MESARRILQVIRAAMLVSIGFYVAISVAIPSTATPNLIILRAVSVLAVMLILTIIVVRRLFVLRSEAALAAQPSDSKVLARWRVGYLLTYVLSEGIALYGVVLHLGPGNAVLSHRFRSARVFSSEAASNELG